MKNKDIKIIVQTIDYELPIFTYRDRIPKHTSRTFKRFVYAYEDSILAYARTYNGYTIKQ